MEQLYIYMSCVNILIFLIFLFQYFFPDAQDKGKDEGTEPDLTIPDFLQVCSE